MITRPDEYRHNNESLSFTDVNAVRGATKFVGEESDMLSLPEDTLKRLQRVYLNDGTEYKYKGGGAGNIANWEEVRHGALAELDAVGTDQIDNNSVTGDKLEPTGVVAGSYTNANISVDSAGRVTEASNGTAPVSDHGALTGLSDDDHTQYHTDSRANTWLATKDTGDLTEGSNLYYTTARANSAIDARVDKAFVDALGVDYDSLDNLPTIPTDFVSKTSGGTFDSNIIVSGTVKATEFISDDFNTPTLGNVTGDTRLYRVGDVLFCYTSGNTFANVRGADGVQPEDFVTKAQLDAVGGGTSDHGALTGLSDDDHTQYHTDARANTWLATKDTGDLTEGSNLYYTTARANSAIDARVDKAFVDALGVSADTLDSYHASSFGLYETGSFTPVLDGAIDSPSATTSGYYVRIGALVHLVLYIRFGTETSNTNPIRIKGMPYEGTGRTGAGQNNGGFYVTRVGHGVSSRTDKFPFYYTGGGASSDYIRFLTSNTTEVPYEDYSGDYVCLTGFYISDINNI